jgi:hypothetical protein
MANQQHNFRVGSAGKHPSLIGLPPQPQVSFIIDPHLQQGS